MSRPYDKIRRRATIKLIAKYPFYGQLAMTTHLYRHLTAKEMRAVIKMVYDVTMHERIQFIDDIEDAMDNYKRRTKDGNGQ